MGLSKRILCAEPDIELTDEEQKKIDAAWNALCENGSVCLVNPSKYVENIKDVLKQNPNIFIGACCDYNGDIPYSEFVERVMTDKLLICIPSELE